MAVQKDDCFAPVQLCFISNIYKIEGGQLRIWLQNNCLPDKQNMLKSEARTIILSLFEQRNDYLKRQPSLIVASLVFIIPSPLHNFDP